MVLDEVFPLDFRFFALRRLSKQLFDLILWVVEPFKKLRILLLKLGELVEIEVDHSLVAFQVLQGKARVTKALLLTFLQLSQRLVLHVFC